MVEIWNPYHDVFDDSDDVSPEEDYLHVAESYELTTPQGVAGDFGCSSGDVLYFEWDRIGDAEVPN